jgi:hypothetical protein
MRKIILVAVSALCALPMVLITQCSTKKSLRTEADESGNANAWDASINSNANEMLDKGRAVFRFETFGDEAFWTDKLQLNKIIADKGAGGSGDGLSPRKALELGLKVDLDILPKPLKMQVREGKLLDDTDLTLTLLKLNAVVGVVGKFDDGKLNSVGITCALCHSTVDDPTGIGKRLDGWPNRDLNVGAIISTAPDLTAFTEALDIDVDSLKIILASWGPGKFDAELNYDRKAFRPDGKSGATLIPEAFGHAGHNNHTWTGGRGSVTYWNAYVANTQMMGKGIFYDPRMMDARQYPLGKKAALGNVRNADDKISDKLAALHYYQLSIPAPKPPDGSYNKEAALRGETIFNGKAKCSTCHVPPLFTEPGWNTHTGKEIGIDDFQSRRSPENTYVTQGLKGLWAHSKGGFYHDGRFATLMDVVNHYDNFQRTALTENEKKDLIEYLKSL